MKKILSALVLTLLAGCANDDVAGGGGFGGETISGRVVDSSGRTVADAEVRLRSSRSPEAHILFRTRSDDSGRFTFARVPAQPLHLEIAGRSGGDSVRALVDLEAGQSPGAVPAAPSPIRRLRLLDAAGLPLKADVQVYGLGLRANSGDSGQLELVGCPAADLWLRVTPQDGRPGADLFVPASASGDLQLLPGWLLDDFEGARTKTRLGLLIGGGWWYAAATGEDSASGVSPLPRNIAFARDTTQAHGGHASLHARFALDASRSVRYGLVGFHFGASRTTAVDLSGLDSLVLWSRGSGTVRAELVAIDGTDTANYSIRFTPGPDWGPVVLRAADLLPVDGKGSWSRASHQTLYLQFIVFETAEFWLDDLRLFGSRLPL